MKTNKKIKSKLIIVLTLIAIIAVLFFAFNNKKIVCNYDSFTSTYKYAKDYKNKDDLAFTYKSIIPYIEERLDYTKEGTIENKKGEYEISYTASYNNITKTIIEKVIIEDEFIDITAPELTLSGNLIETIYVGDDFIEPGYNAIDDVDGSSKEMVKIESNIDTGKRGVYEIKYIATDSSGNETKASRKVLVREKQHNVDIDDNKVVYLTFDDGPSVYTNKLLDLLDKYNIKATFFVTNTHPDNVKMIEEEYLRGHTIAIHTYSHVYSEVYASEDAFYNDQNKMMDIVYELTGTRSTYFRFPGGSSNSVSKNYCPGLMTSLVNSSKEKGLKYFDWNVSSGDGNMSNSSSFIYNYATSNMRGVDTVMLLQHDANPNSMNAMEDIINWCINNGYSFNAIDDNTPEIHHGHLNN